MVTERFAVVENVLAFSRVPVHVNKTKLVKVLLLFTRFCQAFRQGTCGIVKLKRAITQNYIALYRSKASPIYGKT